MVLSSFARRVARQGLALPGCAAERSWLGLTLSPSCTLCHLETYLLETVFITGLQWPSAPESC